ncbi:MAG: hypothetical protein ACRC7N_10400 [Clostridium sp.]
MKIKKKRKGSSLIFVLAMAAIFTIVSGVAASAVVATTKANSGEKIWEDLVYTCEAGVENAVTKAYQGIYNTQIPNYGDTMSFRLGPDPASGAITSGPFSDLKISVFVEVTKSGDLKDPNLPFDPTNNKYVNTYYVVKSTSTYKPMDTDDKRQERSIKAKVLRTVNNNDIFKYSLCADGVTVESGGAINAQTGPVNSSKDPAVIGGAGSTITGPVDKAEFTVPNLNKIRKAGKLEFNNFDDFKIATSEHIKTLTFTTSNGTNYSIYLVSANELVFKKKLILNNAIIICNGVISISNEGGHQTYSSMIAEKINIASGGSLTIDYAPVDSTALNTGHCPLKPEDIKKVNKHIADWSTNWSGDPSSGGGTSVDYWGSISYEY